MRRVFFDTSGFYALIVSKDENHGRADNLFTLAQREAWRLVTTNAVIVETHALLLHRARPGRETALEFLNAVYADTYEVVRVGKNDEEQAIKLPRARGQALLFLRRVEFRSHGADANPRSDRLRSGFPHLRQVCSTLVGWLRCDLEIGLWRLNRAVQISKDSASIDIFGTTYIA